jgi:hypothetical protein
MRYLKLSIVFLFVLACGVAVTHVGGYPADASYIHIALGLPMALSAALFIVYLGIKFLLSYPDNNRGSLDALTLFSGVLAILFTAFTFIPLL